MRITHTGGRTVIELDPADKRDLRADLDRAPWSELSATGRDLFHHLAGTAPLPSGSCDRCGEAPESWCPQCAGCACPDGRTEAHAPGGSCPTAKAA